MVRYLYANRGISYLHMQMSFAYKLVSRA
jgi:hypothetical protein